MVVLPDLGVAPLIDSGTDPEDELPTPDDSPGSAAVSTAGASVPEVDICVVTTRYHTAYEIFNA